MSKSNLRERKNFSFGFGDDDDDDQPEEELKSDKHDSDDIPIMQNPKKKIGGRPKLDLGPGSNGATGDTTEQMNTSYSS